jgi:hypothetical protein
VADVPPAGAMVASELEDRSIFESQLDSVQSRTIVQRVYRLCLGGAVEQLGPQRLTLVVQE